MPVIRTSLAVFALALAVACASAPPPGPPFAERLAAAKAESNPYAMDAVLSELVADTSLATADRAEALYERGSLRRLDGDNRRGAVADFEDMLALAPDHPKAEQARIELGQAKQDADALEVRIQYLLTLSQWFDASWALGERDVPANRFRASGLNPNQTQTRKLQDAGFLCGEAGEGGPVQTLGDPRPWLEDMTWCAPPAAD
ncbi:MAG: hypothetical protein R3C13_00250 [Hyphomonas sp.]|uniref:hypothetical protein n=1 Tax=Hyphomonas sp. TaxID=87 RepID=UPI003529AE2C